MPFTRVKSKIPVKPSNKGNTEKKEDAPHPKRSSSPPQGAPKKRTAFVDITNAHKLHISLPGRKKDGQKKTAKKTTASTTASKNVDNLKKSSSVSSEDASDESLLPRSSSSYGDLLGSSSVKTEDDTDLLPLSSVKAEDSDLIALSSVKAEDSDLIALSSVRVEEPSFPSLQSDDTVDLSSSSVKTDDSDLLSSCSVTSDVQVVEEEVVTSVAAVITAAEKQPSWCLQTRQVPEEFDIDSQSKDDIFLNPEYALDIFDYLKKREEKFVLRDYMPMQHSLNPGMRAILVDWLVEVQENFELNHETLYLAVKLTDHYLSLCPVNRESLQLIGSTTMLIASKFEERSPPLMDDFLYICDDAYRREELVAMECSIMQTLGFDINIPIPYRFLRRYAKCVGADMETLTLARYVCELSLQEMDLVPERGSRLASACLLIALVTKHLGGWSPILQFHTGYAASDLVPVVRRLHAMLCASPDEKLKAIRSKYAHKVFFQVASLPIVSMERLEGVLTE